MKHELGNFNYGDNINDKDKSDYCRKINIIDNPKNIFNSIIFTKIKKENRGFFSNYLLITTVLFHLIIPTSQKNFTDEDCIAENNKNFDFYNSISRIISNPSQCTEKSSSCCYIEINYDYAGHLIDNTFCVLLGGDINTRIQQITGIITDQIRYYSDFIYNNYEMMTSIGNNLNYSYYENYTCYERAQDIDFYYYSIDNCAFTNPDGTCKIVNDYTYKDKYVSLLYKNITKDFCNSRDEAGNCIYYQESPNYNETGLSPLFEYLKASLDLNENSTDKYEPPSDDPIEDKKNNTELSKKFYAKCKPITPAKVRIICPSSYINSYFFSFRKEEIVMLIALFFLIF